MKLTRILAMLLIVVMIIPMVVACNGNDEPAVTTTAPSGNDPVTDPVGGTTTGGGGAIIEPGVETDKNGYIVDNLDPNLNYNDMKINFLAWSQGTTEYDVEDTSGDDVEAAVFERNRKVEDRLGIELVFNEIAGNAGAVDSFVQTANTSISNNSQAYDAVAAYTRCAGVLSTYGVYFDLYEVENIDLEMPWWPSKIVDTNTVADKIFCVTGDIATSLIYQMEFLIINDDYATELGVNVDELQELALAGGWTLDKLFEICDKAYKENDDKPGKTVGDRFGLYIQAHMYTDIFYIGAGLTYVAKDEEGLYVSDDYSGPISTGILNKFASALKTNNSFWALHNSSVSITEGNSLVYTVTGQMLAQNLRDSTFVYSILPGPKYSADQDSYYTAVQFPHSMYSIPVDAPNKDMSGAVLECMASESYRQVTPILFDKCFKYKYATETIDSQMLSLIRDNTTFDLGRTFFEVLGGDTNSPVRIWRNCIMNKSVKIAGQVTKNASFWAEKLNDIYTKLSEIE